MNLLKKSPLLADMLAVELREYIAEIESKAAGNRRAETRARMLRQLAYSIETEYGTTPEDLAAEFAQMSGAAPTGHTDHSPDLQ